MVVLMREIPKLHCELNPFPNGQTFPAANQIPELKKTSS